MKNGRSDPWLTPFAEQAQRERAAVEAGACSEVFGEKARVRVRVVSGETLHQAVVSFARCPQARAEGLHESPRNGDFVSRPRFKVAW